MGWLQPGSNGHDSFVNLVAGSQVNNGTTRSTLAGPMMTVGGLDDVIGPLARAMATNAEMQCRMNEILTARLLKLENRLSETETRLRQLVEERARG